MSAGPGRVQRWLVGYVERWEDDDDGYVAKTFLRCGWDLHEVSAPILDEHPIAGLTYTPADAFEERSSRHRKQRSHMESARRALVRLCAEGTLEESPDKRFVRLPVTSDDEDITRRLAIERDYLKAHGQSASEELLVAITGNIVVLELERRLTLKERLSFATRSAERGDSSSDRVQRLVDYVATKHGEQREQALGAALESARRVVAQWREEDQ